MVAIGAQKANALYALGPGTTAKVSKIKAKLIEGGAAKEDTVVMAKSEIAHLRALINSTATSTQDRQRAETQKEQQISRAQHYKQQLQAIDAERTARGTKSSPEDEEYDRKRQADIQHSRRQMDEEMDEVKHMNKVMQYAKTVTIRDAQIAEKQLIGNERREEEKRMDMMMEMERLKAIKMYEEREQKRIEDRRKGAAVIRAQMEEREQERLRQLELKNQEQEAMLRHIDKMKTDDRTEGSRKRDNSRRLMEDVALANAEQIRLKTRQREAEVEEERRITDYLREREAREQEMNDENERIKLEKEREIGRLRTIQEKAQDKQAELDALRAKRAQEAYDRDWRDRERSEARRTLQVNQELQTARQMQMHEKSGLLAEQAMLEQEEFERIIAVQRAEDEIEQEKRTIERDRRLQHASDLKAQITYDEEQKRKERKEFIEEGVKLKKQREEELTQVDIIKEEKMRSLQEQGVPDRYCRQLLTSTAKK